jgi:signal peptidase I
VNGVAQPLPTNGQLGYEFKVRGEFGANILKDQYDVSFTDVQHVDYRTDSITIPLRPAMAPDLGKLRNVVEMHHQNKPRGYYKADDGRGIPIFPSDPRFDWTEDNFGPLWVPKAGSTIQLRAANLPLYRRAIQVYEHNTVELRGPDILINGAKADSYTFKQDYYWMMGDNRHRSQDARYWGFVPFDHVVGKAVLVWLSTDPEKGGFPGGVRWKRLFSLVR